MGKISNISVFNRDRQDRIKIETPSGEGLVLTRSELNGVIESLIGEDLARIVAKLSHEQRTALDARIQDKIKMLEYEFNALIDARINKITERVISLTLPSAIEAEVNKRVEAKLDALRKML